ncbi:MAG TPA: ImmA/IrrE family metallo-endopeptidase [Candidatus Enterocola sp.]|nr:ImmA/IrrE family metallo-endopeptidase [Candidatus Enterocola sp.]
MYHLFVELNPKPHKCITEDGKKDQAEQNADMFASIFLMPEEGIYKMLSDEEISKHEVKLSSIIRLEHYFSVSRAALLNRLCDLSLIDKSTKDTLSKFYVIKTAEEYGYDTALYKPGNENLCIGDFGEKAHTLFEMEKISEGHYIELLNKLSYK